MTNNDERLFGMLIYLLSFFTAIIGPLIIWMIKREESAFIDYHGKEYFNFFISFTIYAIVSGILVVVLIGVLLLPIVGILAFIFTLIALFKAFNGEEYKIPLVIRFIK
ncbi:DUF4870 domain-containing protein [Gracilibacillus salitolerans]|uniref:DUF4870 domain-containing protein n=1 Tax=Gracilibacillus salitolerans TaxID=2663022 RepID=A0A5Q2TL56_9BACI|nr:DUF4870 domain-containing protein [Gracilibacillus salitolerans]QGH35496.1 DUF4870 domain-containing protein [Gracilibacillus salitolerans]